MNLLNGTLTDLDRSLRGLRKIELASILLSEASADLIDRIGSEQIARLVRIGAELDSLERQLRE